MTVVSDTTAITTLLKAGEERLLKELFGEILVPRAVWDELLAFHRRLPTFILLRPLPPEKDILRETNLLGRGEAEAITLAAQIAADLLLVDDRKARMAAARLGLRSMSLMGVMLRAKDRGLISSLKAMIQQVQMKGGLYLSEAVIREALKVAGE